MAVTDYIYQEETVLKKDFGQWLVAKMIAAGWEQVGSNPPPAGTGSSSTTQFYMMKGKRASDNMITYVGINDYRMRMVQNAAASMQLAVIPFLDYTPGAPSGSGTSTRSQSMSDVTSGNMTQSVFHYHLAGSYTDAVFPLDTPMIIRFCITPHNVSLICRVSPYYNRYGGFLFFGLPDILAKEKVSGATIVTGSHAATGSVSQMQIADTPLNVPSQSAYYAIPSYSMSNPRSPDIHGNFPLMIVYGGDTTTGLRLRMPSTFFVGNGGLMDKDLIQIDNMTFEVLYPNFAMQGGFQSGYVVYRIT